VFVVGDDWTGRFDYLKEQNVTVVYFPYGMGISSTGLKEKIYKNYEVMKQKVRLYKAFCLIQTMRGP